MSKPRINPTLIAQKARHYQRTALMLQGGGALGAYQVGVYQALSEAQCEPAWVCGVSIGAINGAIIAGNAPHERLGKLEAFWALVAGRAVWPFEQSANGMREWTNLASAWMTLAMGQPGFFRPRMINPWLLPADASGATSFYDSSELRRTLLEVIDFDRLNSGEVRLSVGAVNVRTGNNVFFDTAKETLGPEHIMASGALPPALPMIEINGEHYWDGGIVSNTPLQYLLDEDDDQSSLVFQVDLFSARGAVPRQMSQVMSRHKDIIYSSRTRQATTGFKRVLSLRRQLADALRRVPLAKLKPGEASLLKDYSDAGVINLVQLIYQSKRPVADSRDYEFSRTSLDMHRDAGYADTIATLAHPDWLDPPSAEVGLCEHDIHRPQAKPPTR